MKIISLETENVKRIKVARIKPDGAVIEITGKNKAGKTSVLDSIWWALTEAKNIQDVPIRKGADKATIKIDLGEFQVTRTLRPKEDGSFTQSLKVETADGFSAKSPQALLDALVGELTFDPLAFTRMKPEAQFEACRRFVPGFDFKTIAELQKRDYGRRTEQNNAAKKARAASDAITLATLTEGLRDEDALVAQLTEAGQHNADIERRKGNREQATRDAERMVSDAVKQKARASQLREDAARIIAQAEELEGASAKAIAEAAGIKARIIEAGDLPAPIDTAGITEALGEARSHNITVREALAAQKRKAELTKEAEAADAASKALTEAMAKRDAEKRAAITKAKLPVAGLSFGDNCVLLDDLPFDQASGAQQLGASIAIAAAMNPKLRVLRVRDGSLLDSESWALLGQFAETNDMQVWIETVESGRPGAVLMVDGEVAGAEKAPAEKTEAA